MSVLTLGRLQRVDLRNVWSSESGDFTPWLAQEMNLKLLGETIGLELVLESTEKSVGLYRADIVCKDNLTHSWVLIENQLERTDHSHLGQLLTYAAGLDAVTIVWVAERFTDEHRAALDWLNEVTEESINFFGLEIELWQIGNSNIAPKFNVVSQPNDWVKNVAIIRQAESGAVSDTKQLQLQYWAALREFLLARNSIIRPQKPLPQHWTNFAIGRSDFSLTAISGMRDKFIAVQLIIDGVNAKPFYHLLFQERNTIERETGETLEWRELPQHKQSQVSLYKRNVDPTVVDEWNNQHAWLQEKLEAFHRTFASRIRQLDPTRYQPAIVPTNNENA